MQAEVRSAFRSLWRAQRSVFANDAFAQSKARSSIRKAFRNTKIVTEKDVRKQLVVAHDAARLLRDTVVQAKLVTDEKDKSGHYKASFEPKHMSSQEVSEVL